MSEFARLPRAERRQVLQEAASRLGLTPLVVEKDFWVCWMLRVLFGHAEFGEQLVFKGGTSLAMVFGVIERFSEDIDLGFAPGLFGVDEAVLNAAPSGKKRAAGMDELTRACAHHVEHKVVPPLAEAILAALGSRALAGDWLRYEFDESAKSANVLFTYPTAIDALGGYVQKTIKLEFGSLTNQRPQGRHAARPLLARADVGPFDDFEASATVLELERTFWEKATILHSEAHRPLDKPMRDRTARHYSDFAALWQHGTRAQAVARMDLLEDVALHKRRFFPTAWASYEAARPGTLRLAPPDGRLPELARDYARMRPMFMREPPAFESVVTVLRGAEQELNGG